MTFFLTDQPELKRRGPSAPIPSNADGVSAAFRSWLRDNDLYYSYRGAKEKEAAPLALQAGEKIGLDGLHTYFSERAQERYQGTQTPKLGSVQEYIDVLGADAVLSAARKQAEMDPDAWADFDLAQETIDAKAIERQKAEDAADAAQIAMSPNPIRNALIGGLGAGLVDPINLAVAPLGLGGSFLRVVGKEMLLGAAVEVVQHPIRKTVAERLDKEAPNLIENMAMGALAGGVFAGVLDGIPRGLRALSYYRQNKRTERAPDVTTVTHDAAVQKAEGAIADGKDGVRAAAEEILREPVPPRRPLILDDSMRVTPEPTALAPDPITTAPLEPVPGVPNTTDQIVATARSGLAKANKPRKEVLGWLKRQGVDPDGWLGTELKARGLTHRTNPGLFKKGGLKDVDNIVADELMPEVAWKIERAGDTGYLDRESILRVLDEEMRPDQPKRYDRDYAPERAWSDPDPEDRGFFVSDLPGRQFADPENWRATLEADVDRYLASKGWDRELLPDERSEIMGIVATRGGDVDDLVYSAMSRDMEDAKQATVRAMRGEAYGRQATSAPWGDEPSGPVGRDPWGEEAGMGGGEAGRGGSPPGEPEAATGNAPQAGARDPGFPVERTDIGDQFLIPDTRRVETGDRQRQQAELAARQIQSKIRRLNQARVEDDVDGLFAARSLDMFDDLSSPEAQAFMDANVQGMRDMLGDGDFEVGAVADDGRVLTNLSDVLDEIDDEATLIREFNLCRLGGGATE